MLMGKECCGFCQIYDSMHPQSKSKDWNETLNTRHILEAFQGHSFRAKKSSIPCT